MKNQDRSITNIRNDARGMVLVIFVYDDGAHIMGEVDPRTICEAEITVENACHLQINVSPDGRFNVNIATPTPIVMATQVEKGRVPPKPFVDEYFVQRNRVTMRLMGDDIPRGMVELYERQRSSIAMPPKSGIMVPSGGSKH